MLDLVLQYPKQLVADSSNVETQISSFSSKKYASGIFLLHLSVMKLYYIQILRGLEQQG